MGPSVESVLTICSNGSVPLNKMTAMPLYGKNTKKASSPEPRKLGAESWYLASRTQTLPT